jgi:hypothetical protein
MYHIMLGWQPVVDLNAVRDDFTCRSPGYSFLQEEHNGLRFGYKALSQRAWSSLYRGQHFTRSGRWLSQTCSAYFESESELRSEIFAAIHLTAGLPARGPEITSVKVCNTAQVMRSLAFREGRLLLVIEYNKARASNYHAFYIVRYLCMRRLQNSLCMRRVQNSLGLTTFNYHCQDFKFHKFHNYSNSLQQPASTQHDYGIQRHDCHAQNRMTSNLVRFRKVNPILY